MEVHYDRSELYDILKQELGLVLKYSFLAGPGYNNPTAVRMYFGTMVFAVSSRKLVDRKQNKLGFTSQSDKRYEQWLEMLLKIILV